MPGQARPTQLWAPWRSAFLLQPRKPGCIFCAATRRQGSRRHPDRVVARRPCAFALLNRYPYTSGHVLIAPLRHVGDLTRLRPREWEDMLRLAQQLIRRLRAALRPQGFNLGVNLGRTAGAGIPGHLHLHIVPRWPGDTNFMSVVGDTRVISQSLDALYALLTRPGRRG